MPGLALVDHDNLRPSGIRTGGDPLAETVFLVESVVSGFRAVFAEVREVEVRFYGGWTDEEGKDSPVAKNLTAILPFLGGRVRGVTVRPAMAQALLTFPDLVLRGTVRLRTRPPRQKMVDGMIGCDALSAVRSTRRVGVVSDDEDLVPALLAARAFPEGSACWLRTRRFGAGLNDVSLRQRGVRIRTLGERSDA